MLSLALSLGFKRPDPLYRIKSNERKITLALAVRILRNWPQFNLGWLLTGQGPVRLEVGPASGEGNLSPLSGDAVSPQRKFGAPPTAESIVGRWELTHAFSLVDEWQSDGQPDATFACNEIVWDFGPDRIGRSVRMGRRGSPGGLPLRSGFRTAFRRTQRDADRPAEWPRRSSSSTAPIARKALRRFSFFVAFGNSGRTVCRYVALCVGTTPGSFLSYILE